MAYNIHELREWFLCRVGWHNPDYRTLFTFYCTDCRCYFDMRMMRDF